MHRAFHKLHQIGLVFTLTRTHACTIQVPAPIFFLFVRSSIPRQEPHFSRYPIMSSNQAGHYGLNCPKALLDHYFNFFTMKCHGVLLIRFVRISAVNNIKCRSVTLEFGPTKRFPFERDYTLSANIRTDLLWQTM